MTRFALYCPYCRSRRIRERIITEEYHLVDRYVDGYTTHKKDIVMGESYTDGKFMCDECGEIFEEHMLIKVKKED